MISRVFVSVLAVFGLFAEAVWATPPRITISEDRLMAATQTHLYVLRDIIDNTASHYAALQDQHLIEISLESGEATRFWPLRSMAISHLETDEFLRPGLVTDREGDTHDMTAVLREVGAEPMGPTIWDVEDLSLKDGALIRGEAEQLATPFAIRAAARAQLAILRAAYPPIETEDEYRRADRIDFYDLYAEGDWECELMPEGQTLFRVTDRVLIAKLHCEDADLNGAWSFHMIVKQDP